MRSKGGAPKAPPASKTGWKDRLYREIKPTRRESPAGEAIDITLIPYHAWANRGISQMSVWLPLVR